MRKDIWLMHDGASANLSIAVRSHIDATYPEIWITDFTVDMLFCFFL